MKKTIALLMLGGVALYAGKKDTKDRLDAANTVMTEIMATDDKSIPQELLDRAECVVLVPGLKSGGFILAGKFGRGFISCRGANDVGWGAPAGVKVEGGSVGFQAGGMESDLIMLVMNEGGAKRLTQSKFTLGGEASVAAGPVGRSSTAQTDATMRAEIISYSRSRGVFGGIALAGSTLRPDLESNKDLYGKAYENADILPNKKVTPALAMPLITTLDKYSARRIVK